MGNQVAVGYIRVSTQGQTDGYGIEAQRGLINDYAAKSGYEVEEWYCDVISGAKDNRPEWDRLISEKKASKVIVAKSDRIARDVYLYFAYKNELRKIGMEVISATEDVGAFGELGVVLDCMLAAMAEVERRNITMRCKGGRREKAKSGGYSGGNVPYGYKVVGSEYEICIPEADIVKDIFKKADKGYSPTEIARSIKALARNGRPFTRETVRGIIGNRKTYQGYYKYGDMEWVQGKHPAII